MMRRTIGSSMSNVNLGSRGLSLSISSIIDHTHMTTDNRFHTEEEIIKAIDQAKANAENLLRYAETYEMEVKALKMRGSPNEAWLIEEKEKQATHHRRRATMLLETRCKWLGEKLSEFRTYQLPIIDNGDPSIPKRKAKIK